MINEFSQKIHPRIEFKIQFIATYMYRVFKKFDAEIKRDKKMYALYRNAVYR